MTKAFWLGLVFFTGFALVSLWKLWAWIIWKVLNLRREEQVFNLLANSRMVEITGGKGKSWLLSHLFLNLRGVKFTNLPTPQGTYTLTKETCESHWVGQWAAPGRWYYAIDDIAKFAKWTGKQLSPASYQEWEQYVADSGKRGAVWVWTSNGLGAPVFKASEKWIVKGFISFMNLSLLLVTKGWRFHLLPLNNKQITGFYDPQWNLSRQWSQNWLNEVAKRLQAQELQSLLKVVDKKYDLAEEKFDRQVLEKYIQVRQAEEKAYKQASNQTKKLTKAIKKYGLSDQPLDEERLAHFTSSSKKTQEKARRKVNEPTEEYSAENDNLPKNHA